MPIRPASWQHMTLLTNNVGDEISKGLQRRLPGSVFGWWFSFVVFQPGNLSVCLMDCSQISANWVCRWGGDGSEVWLSACVTGTNIRFDIYPWLGPLKAPMRGGATLTAVLHVKLPAHKCLIWFPSKMFDTVLQRTTFPSRDRQIKEKKNKLWPWLNESWPWLWKTVHFLDIRRITTR